MFKRITMFLAIACLLVGGALLAPKPATAQEQSTTYYTYVSEWAVPRAQWATFEKERDAMNPILQRLVADGTIVAWGNDATYVHQEDGYTHEDWFMSNSRAGILSALEKLRSASTGPAFSSVTKHQDYFLHTLVHNGKTASATSGYVRVAVWAVKPGKGEDFSALFMKYLKPALDADVASGTLLMYNFDQEDIHTGPPGTFDLAMAFANADGMDKFYSDVAAMEKDNPAIGGMLEALTINKAHRDSLGKITSYQHK